MSQIKAPWSYSQVKALNKFQNSGIMHPFTCGGDLHLNGPRPDLEATPSGWVCPNENCDYLQTWAHDFMADEKTLDAMMSQHPFFNQ